MAVGMSVDDVRSTARSMPLSYPAYPLLPVRIAEIGIKHVFPSAATPEVLRSLRNTVPGGAFVATWLPSVRDRKEWQGAANIVIDFGFCLQAAVKSLAPTLAQYRATTAASDTGGLIEDAETFEKRLGYDRYSERAKHYAPEDQVES